MSLFSDLLLIAMLMKLLWETTVSKALPWELFAITVLGLPFLLGIGGRSANKTLRESVSIAGLIIFLAILSTQGFHAVYLALLCLALLFYVWGRLARRMLSSLAVAILIFIIIIYLLIRT